MANPNPSPSTRFKKGQSGNPSGRSSKELKAINQAAKKAAILREKALSSLQEKIDAGADPLELIDANMLKLFKDSEDRAHGTPQASTTIKGDENNPIAITEVERRLVKPGD